MITLQFDRGTLTAEGDEERLASLRLPSARRDPRVRLWRAPARCYPSILRALETSGEAFEDRAVGYERLDLPCRLDREPFPYQTEALDAWWRAGGRGVVALPTGSGKTFVAQLAMERAGCATIVVTPTIDLMQQWFGVLQSSFETEVGLVGGGYHEPRAVTVTTYDSAYIHMERLGDRYGLIVFDECHHLPGPSYRQAADASLAPRRLGLTATPEREDGADELYAELIGPVVYRQDIRGLAGEYLSDYETVRVRVELTAGEREQYLRSRQIYLDFLREHGIRIASPGGWSRFLIETSRSERGRKALFAYREQKAIAQASRGKLAALERLVKAHRGERVLVFTSDNATVYRISRRLLVPAITHQTRVKERHEILQGFSEGTYPVLVTSKVLNEGVDVPEASVAVVLSGSGSVREHVQRLGRILRRAAGKRAVLYEVVAGDTSEESVSTRRRRHSAYQ